MTGSSAQVRIQSLRKTTQRVPLLLVGGPEVPDLGAPGKREAATADCMDARSALAPAGPRRGGACPSAISICFAAASGSQVGYVAAKLSRLFSIFPCRLREACKEHMLAAMSTLQRQTLCNLAHGWYHAMSLRCGCIRGKALIAPLCQCLECADHHHLPYNAGNMCRSWHLQQAGRVVTAEGLHCMARLI